MHLLKRSNARESFRFGSLRNIRQPEVNAAIRIMPARRSGFFEAKSILAALPILSPISTI